MKNENTDFEALSPFMISSFIFRFFILAGEFFFFLYIKKEEILKKDFDFS